MDRPHGKDEPRDEERSIPGRTVLDRVALDALEDAQLLALDLPLLFGAALGVLMTVGSTVLPSRAA